VTTRRRSSIHSHRVFENGGIQILPSGQENTENRNNAFSSPQPFSLFLGNKEVAGNLEWLEGGKIHAILNVTKEVKNFFEKMEIFQYKR